MARCVLVLMVSALAEAVPTTRREARLDYRLGGAAASCPAEAKFKEAVAARLGYDPFLPTASRTASVSLSGEPNELRAVVRLLDPAGKVLGERLLSSTDLECSELAAATALAVSIAIDPLSVTRPGEPPDAGAPAVLDAGPPTPVLAPPSVPEAPPGPALELSVGPTLSLGQQPSLAPGLWVAVRSRWQRFSLGLDARAELPSELSFGRGSIRTVLFGFGLSPCVHLGPFEACAAVVAGAMRSAGVGFSSTNEATTPHLLAGLRGAGRFPLTERIGLTLFAEGHVRLVSVTLVVGDAPAWTSPVLAGLLGLAVAYRW